MGAFTVWLVLLGVSGLVGGLSGCYLRGACSWIAALALPPVLISISILIEYYSKSYAAEIMVWAPVALIVAGTPAMITSGISMLVLRKLNKHRRGS